MADVDDAILTMAVFLRVYGRSRLNFGLYANEFRHLPQMPGQKGGKRTFGFLQKIGQERQNLLYKRSSSIGQAEGAHRFSFPHGIVDYFDLVNKPVLARLREWKSQPVRLAVDGDSIAVDPATANESDVIQEHDLVDGRHQLKVANVGHKIGLHDGESHDGKRFPAVLARRNYLLLRSLPPRH